MSALKNKNIFFIFFSFYILIFNLGMASSAEELPVVAVKVNNIPITMSEVEEEISRIISRTLFHKDIPAEKRAGYRDEAVERLIERELQFQEAKALGIKAEKAEIKDKMEVIKKRFPSDKEFKEALKKSNLSEKDLKAKAEKAILIEKVFKKEVEEKIEVSDDEAKAHYETNIERYKEMEQVRLRHIMIKFEEKEKEEGAASAGAEAGGKIEAEVKAEKRRSREEAKSKAEELLARINKGEDFAAVALENSDDSYREKGGDLGYVQRGRMIPELEDAAFKTKAGEIIGPVETKEGFYIIKVEDHKQEKQLSFDEVKDKIRKVLEGKRKEEAAKAWLGALRAKSKIEYTQVKSE